MRLPPVNLPSFPFPGQMPPGPPMPPMPPQPVARSYAPIPMPPVLTAGMGQGMQVPPELYPYAMNQGPSQMPGQPPMPPAPPMGGMPPRPPMPPGPPMRNMPPGMPPMPNQIGAMPPGQPPQQTWMSPGMMLAGDLPGLTKPAAPSEPGLTPTPVKVGGKGKGKAAPKLSESDILNWQQVAARDPSRVPAEIRGMLASLSPARGGMLGGA